MEGVVVTLVLVTEPGVLLTTIDDDPPPPRPPPPPPELICGDTVITRLTMLLIFPAASIFQYWRVYVPAIAVFTDPELALVIVPDPSRPSVHVAHRSENVAPNTTVSVPEPTNVTTGAVLS